ncbi:MAG TPA: hypothetical protein VM509_15130 [Planctomycetota bacterium]|nr:hypothetical protein [Planctomycetota bacterium]
MNPDAVMRFEHGVVHVIYAYDVGLSIDLSRAKHSIKDLTELGAIKHKGYAPPYFQFDPPPLRGTQTVTPLCIGSRATRPEVDVVIYDFGGVSVIYEIEFSGSFEDLIAFSVELVGNSVFREDSRQRVKSLLALIEPAVRQANIDALSEDYLVFQLAGFPGGSSLEDFATRHGPAIARLLRSEADPLSDQEIADVLSARVAFGRKDLALIDWNAALLVDEEPEDVLRVIEFANLQLLELRFLDRRLDRALDRSYEVMSADRSWTRLRMPGRVRGELRQVARLQIDAAILYERVNNALKLLGDQYLARVYRATAQRFRVAEWNAGILRKLETIESIYDKLHDHATEIRMEALEWIIIMLIALELLLPVLSRLDF